MGKTTIGVAIRISKSYRDTYRESRAACRTCILDATAVLLISSPPAICSEQKLALSSDTRMSELPFNFQNAHVP